MKRLLAALFLFVLPALTTHAAVNATPTANALTVNATEDVAISFTITGSDPEGAALTFTITKSPNKGLMVKTAQTSTSQTYTYTPTTNINGYDFATFTVNDGSKTSTQGRIGINVAAANDAPTMEVSSVYSVNEDNVLTIRPTIKEVDGDTTSVRVIAAAAHGSATGSNNAFVYTPLANYNGSDTFIAVVSDGKVDSAPVTVNVTVNAVNDMPTVTSQSVEVVEDTATAIQLLASDADGDGLTVTLGSRVAHGDLQVNATGTVVTYTPTSEYSGTDSFTYRVTDGTAWSGTATVSLNVISGNDAPVVNNAELTVMAGTSAVTPLIASDAEGSALTTTIVTQPTKGTASIVGDYIVYAANPTASGDDTIGFVARDSQGLQSNVGTILIHTQAQGTVVPISITDLEPISGITVNSDSGKVTTQLAQNGCYAFIEGAPLVVPVLQNGVTVDALAGTLHSMCDNLQPIDMYAFLILPDGSAWRFKSEVADNRRLDSYNTGVYDPRGILTYFLHSSRNDSGDADLLTGGVATFANGQMDFRDDQYGHNFDNPIVSLDGIWAQIPINSNSPHNTTGHKIHAEDGGAPLFINQLTNEFIDLVYGSESGVEIWNSGGSTVVNERNASGQVTKKYWALGAGPGGNVDDEPTVGGGCKGYIFDGTEARNDILKKVFNFSKAKTYDPGDDGCVGDEDPSPLLEGSAMIGEPVPSIDRVTGETLFWFKTFEPAVAGGSQTPISIVKTDGTLKCEIWFDGGVNKTPFNKQTTGIVIDSEGNGYTNFDYYGSNGVAMTGVAKIDPVACTSTMIASFTMSQVGDSVSNVTLGADAQGKGKVLFAVGGNLYVYDMATGTSTTYNFGSTDDDVVSGPVILTNGDVTVSGVANTFWHIKNTALNYGSNIWPRFRHDNLGSGILDRTR
ncbi:MAG: Ig-like domain-containing protein [Patescibacteria group bacterium]